MRPLFFASLPLLLLSLAACGGNVTVGSGGTAGSGGVPGGGPDCPAAEPSGQACDVPAVRCTYGDSVRPECRHEWICLNGQWTTTKSVCTEPEDCPSQQQPNVDCKFEGSVCTYDATLCECNSCAGGPCMQTPKWACVGSPIGDGCPQIVPNDGSSCGTEGVQCTYGHPCGYSGVTVTCTGGAWLWDEMVPCPL